ncbi:hypothetical protein M9411_09590 [Pasteurella multocida]|uniref:hypothetical protein n=1 Tax=Pasteurella multocida TaxID=747 RepID=UPI002023BDB8|nr:hypothetical protein [Pasteurella multocida]URJ84929.1 hypothetical protein M9411_09590 [Pasteurella multocida]WRK07328.1 hypothetical protein RFF38_00360 [Pasteurella multocida]WVM63954.1 hypothetical protein V0I11_02775 [Pasteurella multocida]HDX1086951.1 hypothetical protein [Pasteurella multocida]
MSIILNEYERYLIECELTITPYPDDAGESAITMDDLTTPLQKVQPSDVYLLNHQTSSFSIVKTEMIEDRYLMILFQSSNGRASDPAFSKLKTGESRTVRKAKGEGIAVTAHLLIDTEVPDKLFPNKYRAILEEVPGLTRGTIASILTHFTKDLLFSFLRKETNTMVGCRPIFKLDFYASQSFAESFKKGYLCGITATRSKKFKGMDINGAEIIEEKRLIIKTSKKTMHKAALGIIAKATEIAKEKNYTQLKITRSENNRRTSATYNIPNELDSYEQTIKDISESTFAKKHKIPLGTPIQSCQNIIHGALQDKMLELLKGE